MIAWFEQLTQLQRVFAYVAIPATVILLLQTILLFFGIGDGDADGDGVPDSGSDDGLSLFSIRGIVAMLCIGAWSGIVLAETGLDGIWVCIIAVVIGLCAYGMSLLIRVIMRLQSSGNIDLSNAIGKVGRVYIPIPPAMSGVGKINITLQEKYSEVDAATDEKTAIATGVSVRVVSVGENGTLVVERVMAKDDEKR